MAKGQLVGYIRVSTEEQNTARQREALADLNLDKTFTDKASGKDTERPQLQAAFAAAWVEATGVMFTGRATLEPEPNGATASRAVRCQWRASSANP